MYRMPTKQEQTSSVSAVADGKYRMPTPQDLEHADSQIDGVGYRMPIEPEVSNPDDRTISNVASNQTTAIRIDDTNVDVRETWSSDKINRDKADSEYSLIDQFKNSYGELYLGSYNAEQYDQWIPVIYDAWMETSSNKPFVIPWSEYRTAQVIIANPNSDNKIIFFYNGQTWTLTVNGVYPYDLSGDECKIRYNTTAEWESMHDFIPARGETIIYCDRDIVEGVCYPGVKIGDGNAYLADLPFFGQNKLNDVMEEIRRHAMDSSVHVTAREKAFWNNKLNYTTDGEILVFNRN